MFYYSNHNYGICLFVGGEVTPGQICTKHQSALVSDQHPAGHIISFIRIWKQTLNPEQHQTKGHRAQMKASVLCVTDRWSARWLRLSVKGLAFQTACNYRRLKPIAMRPNQIHAPFGELLVYIIKEPMKSKLEYQFCTCVSAQSSTTC